MKKQAKKLFIEIAAYMLLLVFIALAIGLLKLGG